jgi:hypothetical protein
MQMKQTRFLKDTISHATTAATLGALVWLLLTLLPAGEASGQGVVVFNNRITGGAGVGITTHIWGPSTTYPALALIGLGSNDNPSGTTAFGTASSMSLIGAGGSGGQLGYATTFAQLIGAVGANQPESALVPVGQTTTFRSGVMLGNVAVIYDTLSAVPPYTTTIPEDAEAATFEIVAWDNSSGLYSTWVQASAAWQQGLIVAGHSAPFTVTAIGDPINITPPNLNNNQGSANGLMSFNLRDAYGLPPTGPPVASTGPATEVGTTSAALTGTVYTYGTYDNYAWFEWGTTTNYGNSIIALYDDHCRYCAIPAGSILGGLTPGTTYHFRLKADSGTVPAYGDDMSFTTLMPPALVINTGSGYWNASSSTLSYTGGGSQSFVLLQSADPTAPLSAWTRAATNGNTPGSFSIPPVGTAAPKYYRVKSE